MTGTCITLILVILFNVFVGGFAFGYCVRIVFGKECPSSIKYIGGVLTAEVVIPGAIILWLLLRADLIRPPLAR